MLGGHHPCSLSGAEHDQPRGARDQLAASVPVRSDDMAVRIMVVDRDDRPGHMVDGVDLNVSQVGPL